MSQYHHEHPEAGGGWDDYLAQADLLYDRMKDEGLVNREPAIEECPECGVRHTGRCAEPCAGCGRKTYMGRWCSTSCRIAEDGPQPEEVEEVEESW